MKKPIILSLVFAVAAGTHPRCVRADDGRVVDASLPGDEIIAVTIREDGTTNTWTRSDAMDALGLINRKYWRDMESTKGREDWHGHPTSAFTTNTETGVITRIDTYPDGFVWTETGKRRALTPEEAAEREWQRRQNTPQKRIERLIAENDRLQAIADKTPESDEDIVAAAKARIQIRRNLQIIERLRNQENFSIYSIYSIYSNLCQNRSPSKNAAWFMPVGS